MKLMVRMRNHAIEVGRTHVQLGRAEADTEEQHRMAQRQLDHLRDLFPVLEKLKERGQAEYRLAWKRAYRTAYEETSFQKAAVASRAATPLCPHGLNGLDCDECSLARKQAEARARAEREPDRMYDTAEPWER
jgi:hypothetical protein